MAYSYTEEELLNELKRLRDELGKTPEAQDMTDLGKYGENTYLRRFGSWNDGLREAGMEINRGYNIPKEKLLVELERVSEKYCAGNTPSSSVMRKEGKYSEAVYEDRFESWNNALEAANFEPIIYQNFSKEELLEDLERVSEEHFDGYAPTNESIIEYGKYGKISYTRHFGTWNNALEEAGFELNKQRDGEAITHHYGPSWHSQRKKARERDEKECRVCCGQKDESDRIPDIHHIKPSKYWNREEEHKEMNKLSNLISLCRFCHGPLEGKWKNASPEEFVEKSRKKLNINVSDEEKRSIFDF